MSSHQHTVHDVVTSEVTDSNATTGYGTTSSTLGRNTLGDDTISSADQVDTSYGQPGGRRGSALANTETEAQLEAEIENGASVFSKDPEEQRRGSEILDSAAPTYGAGQATTEEVSKSQIPPASSVGQQNAPGKTGRIGEAAMGAFGYGGAQVERPKEEQGLGEKIVNFMGA